MSSIFDLAAHLRPTPRQLADAIARLGTEDVSALPLLDDGARRHLAQAAARLPFKASTPVVGEGERAVRQAFQYCVTLPQNSLLRAFASCLERRLNDSLTLLDPPPLAGAIRLNDFIVQRYQLGSVGITPHRDHVKYTGLVAIVILSSRARFSVCVDRSGRQPREIPSPPGQLLLMRAPGFHGRRDRPFHFVTAVTQRRYSFGLRQDSRAHEEDISPLA